MKLKRDIHSLSTFKRDTAKLMRQMKRTKEPVVLTVNGKAELVVQDAESYQMLLEAKRKNGSHRGYQARTGKYETAAGQIGKNILHRVLCRERHPRVHVLHVRGAFIGKGD